MNKKDFDFSRYISWLAIGHDSCHTLYKSDDEMDSAVSNSVGYLKDCRNLFFFQNIEAEKIHVPVFRVMLCCKNQRKRVSN